jgi:hypothetical protein
VLLLFLKISKTRKYYHDESKKLNKKI